MIKKKTCKLSEKEKKKIVLENTFSSNLENISKEKSLFSTFFLKYENAVESMLNILFRNLLFICLSPPHRLIVITHNKLPEVQEL